MELNQIIASAMSLLGRIIAIGKLFLAALVLVAAAGLLCDRLGLPWPLATLSGDLTGLAAIVAACAYASR